MISMKKGQKNKETKRKEFRFEHKREIGNKKRTYSNIC